MKDILNHIFTNYENSRELSKLGFDEPCIAFYDSGELYRNVNEHHYNSEWNGTSAPTHEQVVNWLFDNYGLFVMTTYRITGQFNEMRGFHFTIIDTVNRENLTMDDYELNGGLKGWEPMGFGKVFPTLSTAYDEAIKWTINYIHAEKHIQE